MNECEFCSLMGKEENRVYEDDKSAAVLYPKPAVLGHIIVFAKEHTTIIEQTPDYIVAHLAKIANRISTALFDALKSQGTNIIIANGLAAGQTTPHFAINIIPRLVNDGLSFNWQPRQVKEEAMDTIELANKLDTIILVSGDGDFVPLAEHLRRAMGCRVEVIAFGPSCSGKLKETADEFIDMDLGKGKYLIRY